MSTDEQLKNDDIASAIRALGVVFLNSLPTILAGMQLDIERLEKNRNEPTAWQTLSRQLHSLAGSGGTFGYIELGNRARALEQRVKPQLREGSPDPAALLTDLREFSDWGTTYHSTAQPDQ